VRCSNTLSSRLLLLLLYKRKQLTPLHQLPRLSPPPFRLITFSRALSLLIQLSPSHHFCFSISLSMSHSVSLSCALAFSVIFLSLLSPISLSVYRSLSLTRLRARGLSLALQPQYTKERTPHPMAMQLNCDHYLHSLPFAVCLSCSFSRSFARSLSSSFSLSLSCPLPCVLSQQFCTHLQNRPFTRVRRYTKYLLSIPTPPFFPFLTPSLPLSLPPIVSQRSCKYRHRGNASG